MAIDLGKDVPYWTADLPGIGGRIKEEIEDFEVEEIPAYQPSGSGNFVYLWVEKRGMGADYFARQIARRLGISPGDVGTAGLKDRRAVARQLVSIPLAAAERVKDLDREGIRVLNVSRHTNKLRPGHLHGNRFRILIRGVSNEAHKHIGPLLDRIRQQGLANFYGPQRFGNSGETLQLGLQLLGSEQSQGGQSGRRMRNAFLRKLALSAVQSALFNQYLACRLSDGLMRKVIPGDVMAKWPSGGMFVAEEADREQARFDSREIVHTGPIFGRKTFAAKLDAAAQETAVLTAAGFAPTTFRQFGKLLQGTRRHNLVYVDDLVAYTESVGIRLVFTLPAGSYATVLLKEIMKSPVALEDQDS
jgi:tRNA pseudouridine13 synthase